MASVAVIGGGLAGLTAAYALRRRGYAVTLHESGAHTGGAVQTVREKGWVADLGANSMLAPPPLVADIFRELRLLDERVDANAIARRRYIVRNGRPVPIPSSPGTFIRTPLFSPATKLRILTEPLRRKSAAAGEESLAGLVRRRLGQEMVDYGLNPMVAGVYAGDPERLSALHAMPSLGALESRYGSLIGGVIRMMKERRQGNETPEGHLFSFRHGMGTIPQMLTVALGDTVQLQSVVTRIAPVGASWLVTARGAEGMVTAQYDAVIATAPAHALARIQFEGRGPAEWQQLGDLAYSPVSVVVSGFRREDVAHPLDGFGMLVPAVERRNTLGTLFSSTLFSGRAPTGHVMLTTFVGGARQPDLALTGDAELTAAVDRDLHDLLGVRGPATFRAIGRHALGIPQYNCGYGRLEMAMDQLEQQNPGLFLAGSFRNGVAVADVMTSGALAAQEAAAAVDPASLIAAEMAG